MQKRKFFIILAITIMIPLIGLSVQCGFAREAPTLKMEIYDGPDYSESDNMVYYRVEAVVTGIPDPDIEFNTDDNVSSLGSGRVEVGVKVGDSYTLTATATNLAGTATVSIALAGEYGEETAAEEETEEVAQAEEATAGEEEVVQAEEPEEETEEVVQPEEPEPEAEPEPDPKPEPEPEVDETSIAANPDISGRVYASGHVSPGSPVFMGDTTSDIQEKGYLSFDISGLHGKTVQDAEINFTSIESWGNPESFASSIIVKVYNYVRLDASDFAVGGEYLASIPISATSYTISGNTLKNELQDVLDNEVRDYFQLKLGLNAATNNNGIGDDIRINCNEAVLI